MKTTRKQLLLAGVCALALVVAAPAFAGDATISHQPSAAAMGFDALVVRPLSLVATVAGTGLFVVSLPFSLLGWNVDQAADAMVLDPLEYTFVRPLGDFQTAEVNNTSQ